jgi:hypothetical protein
MNMFSKEIPRRYTPPTCTLEIWVETSSWLPGKKATDNLFTLFFDDPKLLEEQQIVVKGAQSKLQEFSKLLSDYIENFLGDSMSSKRNGASDHIALSCSNEILGIDNQDIFFHRLTFKELQSSEPYVLLSTNQLFDLLDAFEQYQSELASLPSKILNERKKLKNQFILGGSSFFIAALVFSWWQYSQRNNQDSTSIVQQVKHLASNIVPVIPPSPFLKAKVPLPILTLPTELAKTPILPPPPPTQVVMPPPPPNPLALRLPTVVTDNQGVTIYPSSQKKSHSGQILNIYPQTSQQKQQASLAESEKHPSSSLDPIPQVKEAREYFQQRWKEPDGLTQTLEYQLEINPQGQISQVIPLGKAATIYLPQTSMPEVNKHFVSPLPDKSSATIRLVFLPDGTIETFLQ